MDELINKIASIVEYTMKMMPRSEERRVGKEC